MKRWMIITIAAMMLTGTSLLAGKSDKDTAPPPPKDDRSERVRRDLLPPRMLDELSLTKEQEAKYRQLNEQFKKERDAYITGHGGEAKFEQRRKDIEAARAANDQDKLRELRREGRDDMQAIGNMRRNYMQQLRTALTPEQNQKLDDARDQMRDRMQERSRDRQGKGSDPTTRGRPAPPAK